MQGFKETDIGLLPDDWEINKIENLFDIKQGKQLSAKESIDGKINKPFLRTSNLLWGKIDISNIDSMFFTEADFLKLKLQKGDILVCEGGDIGRTAIWNEELPECAYQNHLHRLRIKNRLINNYFFQYWMIYSILQKHLYVSDANRTTIPNLSSSRLKQFLIPLPSIPEQQKIAHVLSSVQEAIEKTEQVINATKELKKSMLKHLFTYGAVSPKDTAKVKLQETEIGLIPEGWEVIRLEDIANKEKYSFVDGPFGSNLKSIHYTTSGILVIQSQYFTQSKFKISNPTYTSKEKADELLRSNVKAGDIVIAKIGANFGATDIIPTYIERAVLSGNTMKITINDSLANKFFINHYLRYFKDSGKIYSEQL